MFDISGLSNIDAPTANLPLGAMRNDMIPGDGTGTEIVEPYFQDMYYALYAVLNDAGIAPDNSEEGATGSQFLDSLNTIYVRKDTAEFRLYNSAVAHGITALNLTTNTYGISQINDASGGGLDITGVSDLAGISGFTMRGIIGVTDPTDTIPAISLIGGKADGAAGWQALGAAETVFQVSNYTTALMTMLGDGKVGINKSSSLLAQLHVETGTSVISGMFGTSTDQNDIYFINSGINSGYGYNGEAALYLSYAGYQNGYTQFRDTVVGNGKAGIIATFDGSANAFNITSGGVMQHNGTSVLGYEATGNSAVFLRYINFTSTTSVNTSSLPNYVAYSGISFNTTSDSYIAVIFYNSVQIGFMEVGTGTAKSCSGTIWYYASA